MLLQLQLKKTRMPKIGAKLPNMPSRESELLDEGSRCAIDTVIRIIAVMITKTPIPRFSGVGLLPQDEEEGISVRAGIFGSLILDSGLSSDSVPRFFLPILRDGQNELGTRPANKRSTDDVFSRYVMAKSSFLSPREVSVPHPSFLNFLPKK